MKKGIYPGSFDPLTKGHVSIIKEGAELFDELFVSIGINQDKKYLFSLEERVDMLRETTKDISNVRIDSFENKLLVDYAKSIDADYILRGIRNGKDYEYEREMRHINADLNPEITTLFLMPDRELAEVSSSLVRGIIGYEGWEKAVERYVPKNVYNKLLQKFRKLKCKR